MSWPINVAVISLSLLIPSSALAVGDVPAATQPVTVQIQQRIEDLSSKESQKQMAAAAWLGSQGSAAANAVPALITLLDGPSIQHASMSRAFRPSPATAASGALHSIGPVAEDAIEKASKTGSPALRMNAVYALAGFGVEQHLQVLIDSTTDSSPQVRGEALQLIGPSSDPKAIEARLAAFADRDPAVRMIAVTTFHLFNQAGLDKAHAPSVKSLHRVVNAMCPLLVDPDRDMRLTTARVLGELRDPDAVMPMIAASRSGDEHERLEIGRSLLGLGDQRATVPMLELLAQVKEYKDDYCLFVSALGDVRDARAVDPLMAILRDVNQPARCASAMALGEIRDRRAVPDLIHALDSSDSRLTYLAATALSTIGNRAAVEPLVKAIHIQISEFSKLPADPHYLREDKGQLVQNLVWALGNMKDPQADESMVDLLLDPEIKPCTQAFCDALLRTNNPKLAACLEERIARLDIDHAKAGADFVFWASQGNLRFINDDDFKQWWSTHHAKATVVLPQNKLIQLRSSDFQSKTN